LKGKRKKGPQSTEDQEERGGVKEKKKKDNSGWILDTAVFARRRGRRELDAWFKGGGRLKPDCRSVRGGRGGGQGGSSLWAISPALGGGT